MVVNKYDYTDSQVQMKMKSIITSRTSLWPLIKLFVQLCLCYFSTLKLEISICWTLFNITWQNITKKCILLALDFLPLLDINHNTNKSFLHVGIKRMYQQSFPGFYTESAKKSTVAVMIVSLMGNFILHNTTETKTQPLRHKCDEIGTPIELLPLTFHD